MRTLLTTILLLSALLSACGGGGGTPSGGTAPGGIGGSATFSSPLTATFTVDITGGGAYGYYANGERRVGTNDFPNHYGIDLAAARGSNVLAVRGGTVRRASEHRCLGNLVIVEHDAVAGRGHIYTFYAHLDTIDARRAVGTVVVQGDVLGTLGSTSDDGCATGPHLHFEFIESATPLTFSSDYASTGQAPNYDSWRDPALEIPGWSSWKGPGRPGLRIDTVSQTRIPADGQNRSLTITGSNFVTGVVLKAQGLSPNNTQVNPTAVTSATLLTAFFNPGSAPETWSVRICASTASDSACSPAVTIETY